MLKRKTLGRCLFLAGLVGFVTPALAAEEEKTMQVEITGSRISRPNLISTTPVLAVTGETLANMGMENFADLATQLPQFAAAFGASRTQSTFAGVASSGLNLANLRNLSSVRTLVLINGRRAPGGTSTSPAVDFNNIPTANIERIEVITGGAAAVYGADAVAGVINIITKKNFSGVEVNVHYGSTFEGDNRNPSASILAGGKFGDNGRSLFTLQFDRQGQVSCKDRYICAEDFAWNTPGTQVRGPAARSGVGAAGRFFVGSASYTRRNGSFTDANGKLIPFDVAQDGYNRNAQRDIAIPTDRLMLAADIEYKLPYGVKIFSEVNYGQTSVDSKFEGHPFQSGSNPSGIDVAIPGNNPFIPAALAAEMKAKNVNTLTWWQRFSDETVGGARGAKNDRESVRAVLGAKGDFASMFGGSNDWRWETAYIYGRTKVNLGTEGSVHLTNLYNSLRVEADPAKPGSFRCADATARLFGCVPVNPFAAYTPEMIKYISANTTSTGKSELSNFTASANGSIWELPAGSVRAAVGMEYRSFKGNTDHDELINRGLVTGNQVLDVEEIKTTTREIYAELLVPILADKQFAKSMNLELAARKSESGSKSYNTWKFGGDWEPVEGLRFRAMKARAVRVPNPGELSGGGSTAGVVNDPCTAARRNNNATRAANCAKDGIPADYSPALVIEQSVDGLSGANAKLNPEVATTRTYGLVWEPKFVKGLSLAIDRFEIDVNDIITTVSRQIAVDKCYDTANRFLCGAITRGSHPLLPGANYVLRSVNEQLQNVATQSVAGIDIDVRYAKSLGSYGDLDLAFISTIYDKATLVPLTGSDPIDLLGQAGGSTTDQGFLRVSANTNVGYKYGKWKANWNMRYIGAADMGVGTTKNGFPRIPAHMYHNARLAYTLGKSTEIYGGINNLFDKKPPFFASGYSGTQALDTIPAYYDVFGRSYYVGVKTKF